MTRVFTWLSICFLTLFAYGCPGEPEPPEEGYAVSGTVADASGEGIEGVTIKFDTDADAVVTGADGSWAKDELIGEVTVTPEKDGWTFEPAYRQVQEAQDGLAFVGSPVDVPEQFTVTVSADPADGGEVSGGGVFQDGAEISVSASANAGHFFVSWVEDGTEIAFEPSFSFVVESDRSLVASFGVEAVTQYQIELSAEPAEGGEVSGGGLIDEGEEITVTGTAADGFDFLHWTEGGEEVSTDAAWTFVVDRARSLTAHFAALAADFETAVELTAGEDDTDRFTASWTAGNLIADAMRDAMATDAALFPSNDLVAGEVIEPGTFTATELLALYDGHIQTNLVVAAEISVEDLEELLLARSQRFHNVDVQVSGINYTILTSENGNARRVVVSDMDGESMDLEATIQVAFCAFAYGAHYGLEDVAENVTESTDSQAAILLQYVGSFEEPIPASLADARIAFDLDPEQDEPFGVTDVTLTGGDRFSGSYTAGNLITDAIRAQTQADFSTINSTAMVANVEIAPGAFEEADLLALYSSHTANNHAIVADVSGQDIEALLLARSQRFNNADLQVSGFGYDIVLDAEGDAVAVNVLDAAGNPLVAEQLYTITFNSFNYQYYGLTEGDNAFNVSTTTLSEREMLLQYVEGLEAPIPEALADPRITIITQ